MKLKVLISCTLLVLVGVYFLPSQSSFAVHAEQNHSAQSENEVVDDDDAVWFWNKSFRNQNVLCLRYSPRFSCRILFLPVLKRPPKLSV